MKNYLTVNQKNFKKLIDVTEEIRKKALVKACVVGLEQTKKSVAVFARARLNESKLVNIPKKQLNKRTLLSKEINQEMPLPQIRGTISFTTFDEAISSFPYKTKTVRDRFGRKQTTVISAILGKNTDQKLTFLRAAQKGNGRLLSLARTNNNRTSYVKQSSGKSISDILRYDKNMLQKIVDKAKQVYPKNVNRNLNYYILQAMKEIK